MAAPSWGNSVAPGPGWGSEQAASGPSLWFSFALELLGPAAPLGPGQGPTPERSLYPNVFQHFTNRWGPAAQQPGSRRFLEVWAGSNQSYPFVRIEMAKSCLWAEVCAEVASRFSAP